jgi:hypothetical protein
VGGAADLAERNPEPPIGGEAYTDLLCAVFCLYLFLFIYALIPIISFFIFYQLSVEYYRTFIVFYRTFVDFY